MNIHLDVLCRLLIYEYFANSRCLIVFTDDDNNFDFIENVPVIIIQVDNTTIFPEKFLKYFGCQAILMKTNRAVTIFKKFEREIRLSIERFNYRKFIIAPGLNMQENLSDIFYLNELNYVADLIIIYQKNATFKKYQFWMESSEIYELWTHKYVGIENNSQGELLDVWYSTNQSYLYNRCLFPNKLKNQMGRVLRLGTMHYEPYDIIDGYSPDDFKGTEISVMRTFLEYTNTTSKFIINIENEWGNIFQNWTGTGLFGHLVVDKVDFSFAATPMYEKMNPFIDYSASLVRSGVTCLVPAPTLLAGWFTPLHAFTQEMWILIWISFVISLIMHFLMTLMEAKLILPRTRERITATFLHSFATISRFFLFQSVKVPIPSGKHIKFLFGCLHLYSLFLDCIYGSGLSTVMTVPRYERPISTIDDLLRSGLPWIGTDDVWVLSISPSEVPVFQDLAKAYLQESSKYNLRMYTKTDKYTFAAERLPHGDYAIPSYFEEDVIENFILLKEDLYYEQIVILSRKSSVILPLLNDFIMTVFEAGLIKHWQNEAVYLYGNTRLQRALQRSTHKTKREKLKWHNVSGVFGLLIIGYFIGIVTLFLEINHSLIVASFRRASINSFLLNFRN